MRNLFQKEGEKEKEWVKAAKLASRLSVNSIRIEDSMEPKSMARWSMKWVPLEIRFTFQWRQKTLGDYFPYAYKLV